MTDIIRAYALLVLSAWNASPLLPTAPSGEARQKPRAAAAQEREGKEVALEGSPGDIVRWSVPGTRSCGMAGKTWRAVQETCYYPIDVARKPGTVTVTRRGAGGSVSRARITVVDVSFGSENIQLGDIPQRNPSEADLRRNAREQARMARLWRKAEGPARFTLPLAPPLEPMPEGKGFGSTWIFNTTPETTETHAGLDYAVQAGDSVRSMADGTVVLAENLFYSGNSVFVDHGNGLITGYLHLAEVNASVGQAIKRGERVGVVGDTGRTTGPHLHLAARWHGARVNPALLLRDPAKMPAIEGR